MRPETSHLEPHRSWVLVSPIAAIGGRMTLLARQHSRGAPHLPKRTASHDSKIAPRKHCGGQRPDPGL
jgi:hypothetical protein